MPGLCETLSAELCGLAPIFLKEEIENGLCEIPLFDEMIHNGVLVYVLESEYVNM